MLDLSTSSSEEPKSSNNMSALAWPLLAALKIVVLPHLSRTRNGLELFCAMVCVQVEGELPTCQQHHHCVHRVDIP